MALRMRIMGIQTFIIAPDKAHEFQRACYHIDGSYIRISPGSKNCINIMDIRPTMNPIADYHQRFVFAGMKQNMKCRKGCSKWAGRKRNPHPRNAGSTHQRQSLPNPQITASHLEHCCLTSRVSLVLEVYEEGESSVKNQFRG